MNIETISMALKNEGATAIFITSLSDIQWACGFTGSNALLVVTTNGASLITDGRYKTQSEIEVVGARVFIADGVLAECVLENKLLPAEGEIILQADHTSLAQHARLIKEFGEREWIPKINWLARFVAIKTQDEIARIARAQQITDEVFRGLLAFIKPGMTEEEIATEIVYQHLCRGASAMSFDTIVASGPNGALPHARPSSRKLQLGELIVLDFGCFVDGYASDMTRTIGLGSISEEATKVYHTVLDAQKAAVASARANMKSNALDRVARDIIKDAGYGSYFMHSLGHGVGLDIHEWPRISWQSEEILEENMVITIEPGIYVPNQFGVRIEDLVVLKQDGCEVLTQSDKELIIL